MKLLPWTEEKKSYKKASCKIQHSISLKNFCLNLSWALKWLVQQNEELPERQIEGSILLYYTESWQSLLFPPLQTSKQATKFTLKKKCTLCTTLPTEELLTSTRYTAPVWGKQWKQVCGPSLSQSWKNSTFTSHWHCILFQEVWKEGRRMGQMITKHGMKLSLAFSGCQQQTHSWMGNQRESRIPTNFSAQELKLAPLPKTQAWEATALPRIFSLMKGLCDLLPFSSKILFLVSFSLTHNL